MLVDDVQLTYFCLWQAAIGSPAVECTIVFLPAVIFYLDVVEALVRMTSVLCVPCHLAMCGTSGSALPEG
jgi:hypothetical protein